VAGPATHPIRVCPCPMRCAVPSAAPPLWSATTVDTPNRAASRSMTTTGIFPAAGILNWGRDWTEMTMTPSTWRSVKVCR